MNMTFEGPPSALAYMVRGAMPARRRPRVPAITARWTGHRASPEDLAALSRITGLRPRETLPLLYPHTFGFRLSMAVLTSPAFPVPIWRLLQTRNHVLEHHPIPIDAVLDLEVRTCAARILAKGAEYDLHTEVRVAGALAWESLVTFYVRGHFGEPGPASALATAPDVEGRDVAAWTMRDDAHWSFGRFTGDYNGIHVWDVYARRFGFERALYHPARVLAECLARLHEPEDDRPRRLDAWLKGPVLHGAAVRLRADGDTFALYAGPRPCIVGRIAPFAGRRALHDGRDADIHQLVGGRR